MAINYMNPNSKLLDSFCEDWPEADVRPTYLEQVKNEKVPCMDDLTEANSFGRPDDDDYYGRDVADAVMQLKKTGHAEFFCLTDGKKKADEVAKTFKDRYGKEITYRIEDGYCVANVNESVKKPIKEAVAQDGGKIEVVYTDGHTEIITEEEKDNLIDELEDFTRTDVELISRVDENGDVISTIWTEEEGLFESLNKSEAEKDAKKHSELATENESKNKSINEDVEDDIEDAIDDVATDDAEIAAEDEIKVEEEPVEDAGEACKLDLFKDALGKEYIVAEEDKELTAEEIAFNNGLDKAFEVLDAICNPKAEEETEEELPDAEIEQEPIEVEEEALTEDSAKKDKVPAFIVETIDLDNGDSKAEVFDTEDEANNWFESEINDCKEFDGNYEIRIWSKAENGYIKDVTVNGKNLTEAANDGKERFIALTDGEGGGEIFYIGYDSVEATDSLDVWDDYEGGPLHELDIYPKVVKYIGSNTSAFDRTAASFDKKTLDFDWDEDLEDTDDYDAWEDYWDYPVAGIEESLK